MCCVIDRNFYLFVIFITAVLFNLQENAADASSCPVIGHVPNLVKRPRTYQADGIRDSDPYISDSGLSPGWYNTTTSDGQYLMPDIEAIPQYRFCGTVQPIYLKERHPNVESMVENVSVRVTACELYPFDDCLNEGNIEIRKCGDEVQYYLVHTSSNAAFCFDPPEVQGVTNFTDQPTVNLGSLKVSPELVFSESEVGGVTWLLPFLQFDCTETGGDDRQGLTLFYTTYWYIEHELTFTFANKASISKISEQDLMDEGYSLGIYMRCGVKMASSITGLKSELTISDDFFAGIKSSDKVITMDRAERYTLTFTATVPFGCYGTMEAVQDPGGCKHKVHMIVSEEDQCVLDDTITGGRNPVAYHNDQQTRCGFEIKGCYPDDMANVAVPCEITMQDYNMTVTTQSFGNDYTPFYSFRLETQSSGTHDIWKNYMVKQVEINIQNDTNVKNKVCYSHVDPHMQTAKGSWGYENNDEEGEFILYWNTVYEIQVQEKTTSCDLAWRAFCTCAVAIRSGGDIFLINLCNDLKFIGMTSCKDNALVIQKYSELEYQVQTNIGTLIKIRIRPREDRDGLRYDELMNIDIVMSPKDYESVRGLCGLLDSSSHKCGFHDRNGDPISCGTGNDEYEKQFLEEWKLGDSDTNYLTTTCNADVMTWEEENQRLFCHCNCYEKENNCDTVESNATCSPSQYINCTVSREATKTLCTEFTDRCVPENRKRRSAFTFDPEKEMQRKAKLSRNRKTNRIKRQVENSISKENATKMCTERITGTTSVQQYSELLGGYNYSSFIQECIIDVYGSQNVGWISAHETATKDAVQIGFKINSNYTLAHKEKLVSFKIQYCPSNCSGNGYCTEEGICKCEAGYFGTDCGNDKSEGPGIDDVEGGGFCDTRYGSECQCFEIQTRDLAEDYHCKRVHKKVHRNGNVQDIDTDTVSGSFKNMFMGECCFESGRRKRSTESTDDVVYDLYDVSISNDGVNFGITTTLYIFDSTCLNTRFDGNGNVTFEVKSNTCIIQGVCYEEDNVDIDNYCLKCKTATDQFNWTYSCVDSDNQTHEDRDTRIIAISISASLVGGSLILFVICVTVKKIKKPRRAVSATPRFTNAMARESTDASLFVDESTKYQENRLKRFHTRFDE